MPAFSTEELHAKLNTDGKVLVYGVEITKQLLTEFEKNKDKKEGFITSTGTQVTQEQTEQILALFNRNLGINKLSAALKSPGMTKVMGYVITTHLLEELKKHKDDPKGFESAEQVHFSQQKIQDILTILKDPEDRQSEIDSLTTFAKQFEEIKQKQDLTTEIDVQYDTRLSWMKKFFPRSCDLNETIGISYFQGHETEVYQAWEDKVMDLYGRVTTIYRQLTNQIVKGETSYEYRDNFLDQAQEAYNTIEQPRPSSEDARNMSELAHSLKIYFNLKQFDPQNPEKNIGEYFTNITDIEQLISLHVRAAELFEKITEIKLGK